MSALSVTTSELKHAGIDYQVKHGGKHIKVKADGLPLIVCGVTSSDRRSEVKARSLVRRLIRKHGLGVAA